MFPSGTAKSPATHAFGPRWKPSAAAMDAGGRVMLMSSHLGRPEEGVYSEEDSLKPVAARLGELLGQEVRVVQDYLDGVEVGEGEVVLCENVRFNKGEKKDDEVLAKRYAALCDVFVMDAFGTAHRAQASTHGVAKFAPEACAGPLLAGELDALTKALEHPERPVVAIVGGSKVSTKLTVLEQLSKVVDKLIVGGGITNTFLAASGKPVGKSLCEHEMVDEAPRADGEGRHCPAHGCGGGVRGLRECEGYHQAGG